jgi:hypothetical protein
MAVQCCGTAKAAAAFFRAVTKGSGFPKMAKETAPFGHGSVKKMVGSCFLIAFFRSL